MMALHVSTYTICHILIKASKKNRSHHHGGIISESSEEPSTLEGDIGCTYNKSFTRGSFLGKDIITSDTEFFVPWDTWVLRTTTNSNDDLVCSCG
jgi:hypothetical protein